MSWSSFTSVEPSSYTFSLAARTQSGGKSPLTGVEQTLELPGTAWVAELTWKDVNEDERRYLETFVTFLGGRAGRFTWTPPGRLRRGTATGGVVNGAGQTGKSLSTRGWAGGGYAARYGDLIGITGADGRPAIHIVGADVLAATTAVIPIAPAIRRPANDGVALTLTNPMAVFMLGDDSNPFSFQGETVRSDVTLRFVEAIFG